MWLVILGFEQRDSNGLFLIMHCDGIGIDIPYNCFGLVGLDTAPGM
jgi:hypothetical protein